MDLRELPNREFVRHPWERVRAGFFIRALRQARAAGTLLDCGAGDAWFAHTLAREAPEIRRIECWDVGYTDALIAMLSPGCDPRVRFSAQRPPGRYDVVTLLDLVEHVEDDQEFLREIAAEAVHPQSIVLVSVPAVPALFGAHDSALGHFRRYSWSGFTSLLERSGFSIERRGGLFH